MDGDEVDPVFAAFAIVARLPARPVCGTYTRLPDCVEQAPIQTNSSDANCLKSICVINIQRRIKLKV